eukprot:TRINITY_DN64208_c0_g1_i1.p1 TRINITY_DN64208_c0_g1~~TRINITY_DN64208_c0_g1_i1.p1  ORF type:complete len:340 (+),score=75.36 TRINITY_DN64208_c0_g1_i1:85-1104(+)
MPMGLSSMAIRGKSWHRLRARSSCLRSLVFFLAVCGLAARHMARSFIGVGDAGSSRTWRRQRCGAQRVALSATAQVIGSLEDAYRELGLEAGADLVAVKRAFRALARKYHPDVCEQVDAERFEVAQAAYERIVSNDGRDPLLDSKDASSDSSLMRGWGHHKVSDGRTYELWLDLRDHPNELASAQQNAMMLYTRVRSIVDDLQYSLAKEGVLGAVLIFEPEDAAAGGFSHPWVPLMFVEKDTGIVKDAESGEVVGQLRGASAQLVSPADDASGSPEDAARDWLIAAETAEDAQRARENYGFAMRAMVLPDDPAAWAVAATKDLPADLAVATFDRLKTKW